MSSRRPLPPVPLSVTPPPAPPRRPAEVPPTVAMWSPSTMARRAVPAPPPVRSRTSEVPRSQLVKGWIVLVAIVAAVLAVVLWGVGVL